MYIDKEGKRDSCLRIYTKLCFHGLRSASLQRYYSSYRPTFSRPYGGREHPVPHALQKRQEAIHPAAKRLMRF